MNAGVSIFPMNIKRIMEYFEQLYAWKFNNLEEIDEFLKRYKLPKLKQEEIGNLNRSVSIK